jgi:hypothetical protein
MACDGGDKQACDARDALENKAFLSNKSACENGQFQACYHVAIAYEKGQGVSLSPEMAVQTANQGCEGGSMAACTKLGYYYIEGFGTKRNLQSAGKHFEEACESNFGPGCFNLGLMSMEGRGQPKSLDSAIGYFKQACKLGDGRGCNHAGRLLRQQNPPDVKDAVAVLKDGCVQESGESCVQLGAIHLEAPPNYEIAFNAFLRGCELGSGSGCFNGAVVLNQGHLKDVDPSLIGQLLQQGCQLGYAQACEILRQ